jgi:hypothetical protein
MSCPKCGSESYIKKGQDRKGRQRVVCNNCGANYGIGSDTDNAVTVPIVHYSKADLFCPAAKRYSSPLFVDDLSLVTCRVCLARANKDQYQSHLTRNKSFSLSVEAIDLLEQKAKAESISQSSLLSQLIIEALSDG